MNIAEMLGAPVADPPAAAATPTAPCAPAPAPSPEPQQSRQRFSTLPVVVAMVAMLATGFGAGTYLSRPEAPEPSAPAAALPTPQVGDFARLFVELYLTGLASPEDLSAMYIGQLAADGGTGVWINHSAAVAAEALGDDYWAVTVAADTMEMVDGAYQTAGVQYFMVTVDAGGEDLVAVSAPARVPRPAPARVPAAMPTFAAAVPPDQMNAVGAFLAAYLTGQGELARYVSATSQIPLFAVPPYQSVAITTAGTDSLGRIRVGIEAVTGHGRIHELDYTIAMTYERGLWEVSDLVPVVPGL